MDKEGQDQTNTPVFEPKNAESSPSPQFSSVKIGSQPTPDYFVNSNDRSERKRRRLGFDKAKTNVKKFSVIFKDYFKHPIRGKHKILTIIIAIAIIVIITLIVLSQTIWRPKTRNYTPLSDDEIAAWDMELANLETEGSQKSDEEIDAFYTNLIDNEMREMKMLDLMISYARELAYRGFINQSLAVLSSINIDDLDCTQMVNYYGAYAYAYYINSNMSYDSQVEYYADLRDKQDDICWTERTGYPALDQETIEEKYNQEFGNGQSE